MKIEDLNDLILAYPLEFSIQSYPGTGVSIITGVNHGVGNPKIENDKDK